MNFIINEYNYMHHLKSMNEVMETDPKKSKVNRLIDIQTNVHCNVEVTKSSHCWIRKLSMDIFWVINHVSWINMSLPLLINKYIITTKFLSTDRLIWTCFANKWLLEHVWWYCLSSRMWSRNLDESFSSTPKAFWQTRT